MGHAECQLCGLELQLAGSDRRRQRRATHDGVDDAARHPRFVRILADRDRRHDVHRHPGAELRLRARPRPGRLHQVGVPARDPRRGDDTEERHADPRPRLRRRPDLLRHPRRTGVRARRGDRRADLAGREREHRDRGNGPRHAAGGRRQGHRRRGRRRARRPRPRHRLQPRRRPVPVAVLQHGAEQRGGHRVPLRPLLSGRPGPQPGARHLVRRLVAARRRRRLGLVHLRRGAESLLLRHEQLRPVESGLPPGVGRGRAGRGRGPHRLPEQLLRVDPGPRRRQRRARSGPTT